MKLTSDLDYSLTKKRFMMMRKRASLLRSGVIRFLLIPVLGFISFTFCSEQYDSLEEGKAYLWNTKRFNVTYIAEPKLYIQLGDRDTSEAVTDYFRVDKRVYGPDDTYFTGVQTHTSSETGLLGWESVYENGLVVERIDYDDDGVFSGRTEYEYEDVLISATRVFDEENNLIQNSRTSYNEEKVKDQQVFYKGKIWVEKRNLENGLFNFREYHQGIEKLKFEMFSNDSGYQNLMTLYDEQGDMLQQERYKNGELIEKIK